MVDWKKVKCTECKSFRRCRKDNISKGSQICQERKKLVPKKVVEKTVSEDAAGRAMLWSMLNKKKEKDE